MTGLTDADLEQIEQRAAAATPGPWFARLLDDDYAASFVAVSATPDDGSYARWPAFTAGELVAATLVQTPVPYVNIADQLWDENAAFIANAREDIPRLLAEIRRLHGQLKEDPSQQ